MQTVDADLRALEVVAPRATELAKLLLARGRVAPADRMRAAEELSWRLRQATGLAKAGFVAAFVRLLVESGEKVVLFGWHHEVYDVWREQLADLSPVFFTGAESTPQKDAARKAFVEGDAKVLVMSLRAGAGLDGLQNVARTVVFGELDWSPGVHEQCVGRIYRDGQGEPVVAYFLVAEVGSDPIVASVLGLKRNQSEGLRDPEGALVEDLTVDAGHIRRLAEGYLAARGEHVAATALESDG
jgi:superfamily II DNA or RNA helicase